MSQRQPQSRDTVSLSEQQLAVIRFARELSALDAETPGNAFRTHDPLTRSFTGYFANLVSPALLTRGHNADDAGKLKRLLGDASESIRGGGIIEKGVWDGVRALSPDGGETHPFFPVLLFMDRLMTSSPEMAASFGEDIVPTLFSTRGQSVSRVQMAINGVLQQAVVRRPPGPELPDSIQLQ